MAAAFVLQPFAALAQEAQNDNAVDQRQLVQIAPRSSDEVASYTRRVEDSPYLSHERKLDLIRKRIKYVFVLFQENRSFDFYFGTYPGARGLFSQPASETPGFVQPIVLTDGSVTTISPFLIPQSITNVNGDEVLLYPEDTDTVNHGHTAIDAKLDLNSSNVAQNDRYAFTEEATGGALTLSGGVYTYTGPAPTVAQVQKGYLVVSHEDCDTVPFMWTYASYIAHHNGVQYFGYEANNPGETQKHLKGLGDFYTAINAHAPPAEGGVFYVRGGYGNLDSLTPRSPSPAVEAAFPGNDDHPGYSDGQISEALLADSINAIARSPYWPHSAIIITYDESDGLDDPQWAAIVNWTVEALIQAEESGVTQANLAEMKKSDDPVIRRLLGVQRGYGQFIGLDDAWATRVIETVGNYGEMFERDLGSGAVRKLPRGPNNLWTQGGLMYTLPIR
jgi:hypothetical protein